MDCTRLEAAALAASIAGGHWSCRELMSACLDRIDALNPQVNAIVSLRPREQLLAEADARDAQRLRGEPLGLLHGFPLAIKDLAATAGLRTTQGSPLFADHVPTHDSLVVARMKAAGGIVIGKTNTPEFGLGSHTYNRVFGTTTNAWDTSRTAGGSSGGAAVSLALRLQPLADGSDMMGSLRNPAAFNHVFGLRPSAGRVPHAPAADQFVNQLSTDGPMGRRVADVARLLAVQAGPDLRAPLSLADDPAMFAAPRPPSDAELRSCRIGWLGDLGGHLPIEPGILALCEQGLRRFEALGCAVEAIPLGFPAQRVWETWLAWRRWLVAGKLRGYHQDPAQRAQLKPEAVWEVEQGLAMGAADAYAASQARSELFQHLLGLYARFDVLVLPSAQVWPFDARWDWPKAINGVTMDTYHRWMEVVIIPTLAGLPAVSVPLGFSEADTAPGVPAGLPMGMQLIGPPRGDLSVLRWALAYESTIEALLQREPAWAGGA